MWNIIYLFTGLGFWILLFIVIIVKKSIVSEENTIFKNLIIANGLEYLFEITLQLLVRSVGIDNSLINVFCRLYIASILLCYGVFSHYTILVCLSRKKTEKEKKTIKKMRIINNIWCVIGLILLFTLPFTKYYDTSKMYVYGQAVDTLKLFLGSYLLIWGILILMNIKTIIQKKYIPIITIIATVILSVIIQSYDPSILISTVCGTIICYTMYHTIENPDLKLLREAHQAKEISDSANEEKTLFVYNMTQEIREVTNKINDDTDLILDSKDYEEIYDSARDIKALTSKFTSTTNEILDMSQVDATTIKIYNEKYNVKNIIKQLVNVYGDICKNKDLSFRTNIDHDIPDNLYGDGISLKEVLTTILNNSTKYTDKGYVELNVNTIIKNDICRLIFTIDDSGTGIKSEDINKIKIDNKSLSKANKMITLMNGTMFITSDYGIGTKVKVILDQKIGESEVTEVSKYESTFDNISILSVDDSESGLKIIDKLLKGTNIKLDLASTGKECLDKIKIGKYDLILLDEELSQISGIELMQKIKEIRNFKTPVILLTKDNSYEYNEEYTKLGFVDYILKPLKKDELLLKINKYTMKDKK